MGALRFGNLSTNAARSFAAITSPPVWRARASSNARLGLSDLELLRNYPSLAAEDLANAWAYARSRRAEIDAQIAANEED